MIKTFTQTDLVRYLYQETTEEESREIEKALLCDSELKNRYNQLISMKKDMDAAQLEPSPVTVLNIISYAKSLQEKQV